MTTFENVPEAPRGQVPESIPTAAGYFTWYERDGVAHTVSNPNANYCYPMFEGAIKGYNGTNSRVWLYENTDCSQDPASYVDPGLSWDNTSTGDVLWGFRPSS